MRSLVLTTKFRFRRRNAKVALKYVMMKCEVPYNLLRRIDHLLLYAIYNTHTYKKYTQFNKSRPDLEIPSKIWLMVNSFQVL